MVSQAGKDIVAGTAGGVAQVSPVALCLCILSELTLRLLLACRFGPAPAPSFSSQVLVSRPRPKLTPD